jgi:hypothetical protein
MFTTTGFKGRATRRGRPIIDLISQKLNTSEEEPPFTLSSYIRGSSFANLCPREEILRVVHKVSKKKVVAADGHLTFAHGTGIHLVLQNKILPAIGVIYGKWSCCTCGYAYGDRTNGQILTECLVPRPSLCERCNGKEFLYQELLFENSEYRINGHPDGFLRLPGLSGLGLFEAKSISSRSCYEVKGFPKIDHVVQVQIYLWLTGLQWAEILYWEKGANGISALIEHHIERDEELIDKLKHTAMAIWDGIALYLDTKKLVLPDRICAICDCPRAKLCSVAAHCFKD